jgi:hypothetical protein
MGERLEERLKIWNMDGEEEWSLAFFFHVS